MRIAHATDIHWFCTPTLGDMVFKRILGTANLVLRGRKSHFDIEAQSALVSHIHELSPDAFIISGDLTSQALPTEFATAREALEPVLAEIPTFVVPGNHDMYTQRAYQERTIEKYFGDFMHLADRGVSRLDLENLTVIGLDPNRATWINASGVLPQRQLDALEQLLNSDDLTGRFLLLVIHYPVLGPSGTSYDNWHHGLLNVDDLIAVLERSKATPNLIIHGHKHHGYTATLELSEGRVVPTHNCGSSGYSRTPDGKRAAATNLYTVEDGALQSVERFIYDGERFISEPGGLYKSGY